MSKSIYTSPNSSSTFSMFQGSSLFSFITQVLAFFSDFKLVEFHGSSGTDDDCFSCCLLRFTTYSRSFSPLDLESNDGTDDCCFSCRSPFVLALDLGSWVLVLTFEGSIGSCWVGQEPCLFLIYQTRLEPVCFFTTTDEILILTCTIILG